MNEGYIYRDRVAPRFAGRPALEFYAESYPHSTAGEWAMRFREGRIRRAGAPIPPEAPLRTGDQLEWHRPPWQEPPVPTEIPVVLEDDDLLVVNKPAGLPVLPRSGYLQNTLLWMLRRRAGTPHTLSPVHRLDCGTSGLLVLGKTRLALQRLGRALARGEIERRYLAVLEGLPAADEFTVDQPIGRLPYPRIGFLHGAAADGKPARTRFRVLERDTPSGVTLAEARLESGRTHQIRIHAAVAGYPLAGDPGYLRGGLPRYVPSPAAGSALSPVATGYRLHSWQARLQHPRTAQPLDLTVAPPDSFWTRTITPEHSRP